MVRRFMDHQRIVVGALVRGKKTHFRTEILKGEKKMKTRDEMMFYLGERGHEVAKLALEGDNDSAHCIEDEIRLVTLEWALLRAQQREDHSLVCVLEAALLTRDLEFVREHG